MVCQISFFLALLNLCLLLVILRRMRRGSHRAAVLRVLGVDGRRK